MALGKKLYSCLSENAFRVFSYQLHLMFQLSQAGFPKFRSYAKVSFVKPHTKDL